LEPLGGVDLMQERRRRGKVKELCNGPAKLTQALGITGDHHEVDPLSARGWVLAEPEKEVVTITSTRIGISQATDYPWRFVMNGSRCVSVPV
jgi:DNA-3-methyladenine glycosylase